MAVAVVNASVSSVEVLFPGNKSEIWYQVNNGTWTPYNGGEVEHIPVDIETVSHNFDFCVMCYIFNFILVSTVLPCRQCDFQKQRS